VGVLDKTGEHGLSSKFAPRFVNNKPLRPSNLRNADPLVSAPLVILGISRAGGTPGEQYML
jgi:hypothetical protein